MAILLVKEPIMENIQMP